MSCLSTVTARRSAPYGIVRRSALLAAAAGAVLSASTASRLCARAHEIALWNSGTTGNWNNGANWSTSPAFPNNGGGNTYDAVISDPADRVNLNGTFAIQRLELNSGSLTGTGALTLNNGLSWNGGAISGAGTINITGGQFDIDSSEHRLSQFHVTVGTGAVANWYAGQIDQIDSEGGTFENFGTFSDFTDDGWFWNSAQTPVFINRPGAFYYKADGTPGQNKLFWARFDNQGVTNVNVGNIWFAGGGTSSGIFNVAAGSELLFSDFNEFFAGAGSPITTLDATSTVYSLGAVTFINDFGNANTDIHGYYDSAFTTVNVGVTGQVRFNAGAVFATNFTGDWQVSTGALLFNTAQSGGVDLNNLTMIGGEIGGSDDRNIDGAFTWQGGKLSGAGITYANSGLFLSGGPKALEGHTLVNGTSSPAAWSGGDVSMTGSTIRNEAGATWSTDFDGVMFNADSGQASRFQNDGTFVKLSAAREGVGSTNFDQVRFDNNGTVDVTTGRLRLGGGGRHTGVFLVAAGTTLELGHAFLGDDLSQHDFDPGSQVSGPGGSTVHIAGITGVATGAVIDVDHLLAQGSLFHSGTLTTNSSLISAGAVSLFGGTWNNAGAISVGGASEGVLFTDFGGRLSTGTLEVAPVSGSVGTASMQGSDSQWDINGPLAIGGTPIAPAGGAAAGTMTVDGGTVTVTGGTRVWANSVLLYNSGTLNLATLTVDGGGAVRLAAGADKVLRATAIAIDTADNSYVDLQDNDLLVDYAPATPNPYAQITSLIAEARNFGSWDGPGITSSAAAAHAAQATTLGILHATEYFDVYGPGAPFEGRAIDATSVLVKYTWYGDTDFSGVVDFDDYVRIDGGFNGGLTGWLNGDFDLSGAVDFDDYVLIDLGFNVQDGTLRRATDYLDGTDRGLAGMDSPGLRQVVEHFDRFGIDYATHFLAAVPEPAGAAIVGVIAAVTLSRRRAGRAGPGLPPLSR